MKVLAIDPGYGRMGYAVVESRNGQLIPLEYGVFETNSQHSFESKLLEIRELLKETLKKHSPDAIASERLLFSANKKTAIGVAMALGTAVCVCAENGLKWFEYTPAEVKTAVSGNGSAEKRQVKFMVSKIMKIQQEIKPDDAADALAIAICHLNRGRSLGL